MKHLFGFMFVFLLFFTSCNEKVESKPNLVFKSSGEQVNKGIAAKVAGEEVSYQRLYQGIENEIFEAEMKVYELKMNRLKAIMLETFMKNDPNKKGLSNDEYLEKYISKDFKPSQKEIDEFIKNRGIPEDSVNDKMKERIVNFLSMENKKKDVDAWINKKTKSNPVEIFFEKPSRPTFDVEISNEPTWGDSSAKVTIVEFSDFQCPFCKKGKNVMDELKDKYGKKIKIVFKNFPLPFHINAKKAAEAGLCANEQGSENFWKMHDKMFNDQTNLDVKSLKDHAKKLGLNQDKFNKCLDSNKYAAAVEKDLEYGKKIGVKSTPTFFVNGQLVNGAHPKEVFVEIIDPLL